VAGKSTLNREELSRLAPTRYHKISHNPMAIKRLLVDLFLEAPERAVDRATSVREFMDRVNEAVFDQLDGALLSFERE